MLIKTSNNILYLNDYIRKFLLTQKTLPKDERKLTKILLKFSYSANQIKILMTYRPSSFFTLNYLTF